jgi:hypothetical protein
LVPSHGNLEVAPAAQALAQGPDRKPITGENRASIKLTRRTGLESILEKCDEDPDEYENYRDDRQDRDGGYNDSGKVFQTFQH